MKTIAICGSQRENGNTEFFMRVVLDELASKGVETEFVSLRGKTIQPCRGCYQCLSAGHCTIEDDFAGRIRNAGVRITGANFVPPNANKVSDLLDELIQFVNENPLQLNDIELATIFHHKLVWIHPFFDGNGRTVRLAMNLLLKRRGFPPAIILKKDRKKYYDALNQANNGNYQKLTLLMCQALERTVNIYLTSIPSDNDEDYQSIANIVSEPNTPYSQEYVSLLARQGKIDAYKEGRNWVTTKKAINDYINNRQRKRLL